VWNVVTFALLGDQQLTSWLQKVVCCMTLKGDDNIIFIIVDPMHQLWTLFICVFVVCEIYALEECT
jgi:hypothetical protein